VEVEKILNNLRMKYGIRALEKQLKVELLDYSKSIALVDSIWCWECKCPHEEMGCLHFGRASHLYGNDECLKAYTMVERYHRIRKKLANLLLVYQNDPSEAMLTKAKEKYDALNSLVVVVEEKYIKSAHLKQEDKPRKNTLVRD